MTATTAAGFAATRYDSWDLQVLREAKAYRDQIGESLPDQDAKLLEAERQFATGTAAADEAPVADEEPRRPRSTSGASNYGATSPYAPSPKQLDFIAKLVAERGLDPADFQPRDKKAASATIDRLLAMPRAPRQWEGGRPVQDAAPAAPVRRGPTEGQLTYLRDLWATREHEFGDDVPDDMTFDDASGFIEHLKAQPRRGRRQVVADHGIRPGRYAHRDEDGHVEFYVVDRNGKLWIQAGPVRHPYNGQLNAPLLAIKADPKAGAALYGQEIGACGRCGLPLTDDTSRSIGLGPKCAGKDEW